MSPLSGDFLSHAAAHLFPKSDIVQTQVSPPADIGKYCAPETVYTLYAMAQKQSLLEGEQCSVLHGQAMVADWRSSEEASRPPSLEILTERERATACTQGSLQQ